MQAKRAALQAQGYKCYNWSLVLIRRQAQQALNNSEPRSQARATQLTSVMAAEAGVL